MGKTISIPDANNNPQSIFNDDGNIVTAVDGNLTPVNTDWTAVNPTANTSGASDVPYVVPLLLRWVVKGLQSIFSRMPALQSGRIPVDVASLAVTVNNASLEITNDVGNPIPSIESPFSLTPVSAPTTSGTANTWSQVFAANSTRRRTVIQNKPTNNFNLVLGLGSSGSEIAFYELEPGNTIVIQSSNRISIQSPGASVGYYAAEG